MLSLSAPTLARFQTSPPVVVLFFVAQSFRLCSLRRKLKVYATSVIYWRSPVRLGERPYQARGRAQTKSLRYMDRTDVIPPQVYLP